MRVRFTPRAVRDLAAIYDNIARRSYMSAQRVEDTIRVACLGLADFPEIGVLNSRKNVRRLPVVTYRFTIFYRVMSADGVWQILRIAPSAKVKTLANLPR